MKDYSWITDEAFDQKLGELLKRDLKSELGPLDLLQFLISVCGGELYHNISEYYNNEVLVCIEIDNL